VLLLLPHRVLAFSSEAKNFLGNTKIKDEVGRGSGKRRRQFKKKKEKKKKTTFFFIDFSSS
jgi:hypothetical protein